MQNLVILVEKVYDVDEMGVRLRMRGYVKVVVDKALEPLLDLIKLVSDDETSRRHIERL